MAPVPPFEEPGKTQPGVGGPVGLPNHTVTTPGEAARYLLGYLETQNRPFNAQIIADNMRGKIRKSLVETALLSLVQDNKITEKVFGKARVYWRRQDELEVATSEQLDSMRKQLEASKQQLAQDSAKVQKLSSDLKRAACELSDGELDAQLELLQEQVDWKNARLSELKASKVLITAADRAACEKQYKHLRGCWKKRKRLVRDALDQITMNMDKFTPKTLGEEIGIETDEDWNVQLGHDLI
eukprot:TRINITY_DN23029_c0_g1_i2.p1 TRINITY_DN23029_c0_g1~~TRINITY_DN23029_c0_g1_i2.p1  ORF type:complete len:241 (+),score=38.00 TRINITY_DN23029_c0_g1_i2:301-1023(+)